MLEIWFFLCLIYGFVTSYREIIREEKAKASSTKHEISEQ